MNSHCIPETVPYGIPRTGQITNPNNFPNFREITARFSSVATACNHAISKGDVIGWNRRTRSTFCKDCWLEWRRENDAAAEDERFIASQYGNWA